MADQPIKYSDLVIDDGAIDKLIQKIQLLETTFLKSQKTFQKAIAKTKKATEESNDATGDQEKELEKLEKQLEKLLKANEELSTAEGQMNAQKKSALKLAKQEQALKKKLIELTDDQALANEELKVEISEQQKVIKAQAKANKGLTGEYEIQSKRLNDLRKQYKNLAVAGKENTAEAKKLLSSVTELDAKLKDIDKSVGQTQRSVGNYKDQVKEALEETDLFSGSMAGAIDESGAMGEVISKLQTIIGVLTKFTQKSTVATEVNEKATKSSTVTTVKNTTATSLATKVQQTFSKALAFTSKAFGKLKVAMVKSGIGLIIVGLASIISALSESSAGVDGLSKNMAGFGLAIKVIFGRIALFGKGLIDVFQGIVAGMDALNQASKLNFEGAKKSFSEAGDQFGQAGESFSKAGDGFVEAVKKAFDSGKKYSVLTRDMKKNTSGLRVEMAKLNAEAEIQEEIEADATRSFKERRIAIEKAIILQKKASDINSKITKLELDAEKVKLNAFSKGTESRLNQQNIVNEKTIANIEAETEADIKAKALERNRNMLDQDEREKDLDIILDGFDNQKTINEQLIASDKKRFDERRKLLNETIKLQKTSLEKEVKLIQGKSKTEIDIRDLIQTKDSILLKEKIRGYELSEILEQRLLEVVREARTQERDLDQAGIDLDQEHFEIKTEIIRQLEDLRLASFETEKAKQFELIRLEEERAVESLKIQQSKFSKTAQEYKDLDKIIAGVEAEANERRKQASIDFFVKDQELAMKRAELELLLAEDTQKEIGEKLKKLKIEQLNDEIKERKKAGLESIDQELELARLKAQKELEIEKDKASKIKDIQDKTADAIFNSFSDRLNKQISELDKLEAKQLSIIDNQEQRAIEGLQNNLAFEESALAELEQKKIKAQKRQIALDKVQALYNAYSSASASGDKNAIVTVLRDFAILQGIESAIKGSFGDGTGQHGDINDSLKAGQNGSKGGNSISNGIIRGESHSKRGFGVPILAEGNEGIWKGSTMDKFGKNNFVELTKAIDNGSIGSNFMQPQVNALQVVQSGSAVNGALLQEMKETRKAIQNKPEQVIDVQRMSDNILDFVDTRKTGNKRIINRYRVQKKRI